LLTTITCCYTGAVNVFIDHVGTTLVRAEGFIHPLLLLILHPQFLSILSILSLASPLIPVPLKQADTNGGTNTIISNLPPTQMPPFFP
jgi:hypothetical protein